jgi:hypothetical protein
MVYRPQGWNWLLSSVGKAGVVYDDTVLELAFDDTKAVKKHCRVASTAGEPRFGCIPTRAGARAGRIIRTSPATLMRERSSWSSRSNGHDGKHKNGKQSSETHTTNEAFK